MRDPFADKEITMDFVSIRIITDDVALHRFKTNRMSSDLGIHKVSYTAQ